ncbi:choline dehydrogenase [Verticillium alfalfae VaMs.102]|uniref:Choline dehydrogenase n=1 Tax=Verticillium alfalfae (strain VaMs.102 / ATCC MYA-4576 / FGSC 10136) TaxID=526221 RepID=C9SEJ0_VERA1|nr:choline dehydrogenase [Verticillium alfalfae VaMs.102]EEY16583.1 choline dehydrogenase [Verticillium alfalfae VaMs.102]
MRLSLIPALFGVLAAAVPTEEQAASHREDKRQLGSLLGIFNRDATFDYVIIGGGTAGLTLANRLSANRDITVAVVEAGSFYQITNPALGQTPAGDTIFAGSSPSDTNPLVDWNFVTEPQAGAGNRKIHYARGKCLGGSSARNFMVYQRGTKQSYQKWADAVGDDSYTWDALQPHFRRSARLTAPAASRFANASAEYDAAAFSPAGGPLQVSYANYAQPFSTWLEPALNEIGVADADDFNSGRAPGRAVLRQHHRPQDADARLVADVVPARRPRAGRTSRSTRRRWRARLSLTAPSAPRASSSRRPSPSASTRSGRARRSSCRRAPSSRRSCSWSRAWARARSCPGSASPSSPTGRASGRRWRTTSSSGRRTVSTCRR